MRTHQGVEVLCHGCIGTTKLGDIHLFPDPAFGMFFGHFALGSNKLLYRALHNLHGIKQAEIVAGLQVDVTTEIAFADLFGNAWRIEGINT